MDIPSTAKDDADLVWLYASFTERIDGGNPGGVVVSSRPFSSAEAQSVASVFGVPTTGFVLLERDRPQQSVPVRFFTPRREIDACGHVTVAIAYALVEQGLWEWGGDFTVHTRGGDLPLRLRANHVEVDQQLRVLEPSPVDWHDVEAALGALARHDELPLHVAGTALRHLMVPLRDSSSLAKVSLDADRIGRLATRAGVETICVFAPTGAPGRVRVRDLCAAIGAIEEPASGTTSAALALYLHERHLADGELVVEQGVEMGRPSHIEIRVRAPGEATIRGTARKVLAGVLAAPTNE
jgi:trans-2,3-dihydro-3-hydroxyanthranilate isomerase